MQLISKCCLVVPVVMNEAYGSTSLEEEEPEPEPDMDVEDLDPTDVIQMAKQEMKEFALSQTFFAKVAMDRSQSVLCKVMNQPWAPMNLRHITTIAEFLEKPQEERVAIYRDARGYKQDEEFIDGMTEIIDDDEGSPQAFVPSTPIKMHTPMDLSSNFMYESNMNFPPIKKRTFIPDDAKERMDAIFITHPYVSAETVAALSLEFNIDRQCVRKYFANRRARSKPKSDLNLTI